MSTDLTVIVDDISGAFSYSWTGGNTTSPWTLSTLPQWYKTTSRYPASTPTQIGEFTFTFNGTSAAFIGNSAPASAPQTAVVQIDNGTSYVYTYQDPNPQNYMQWFTTPTLPAGNHTVTLSNLTLISLDYAVVKVGDHTPLGGQTIIVDDDSPLIQYSGQWSRNSNKFIPGNLPTGFPYGNVTHRSSNPGDTFTFQFTGTSVAVYGIVSWYNIGTMSTTYTLDGATQASTVAVTSSSLNFLNKDGDAANYLYYSQDNLSSGTHTLVVNVTQATNQYFILDYITYKPSFETLAAMPPLSLGATSSMTGSNVSSTASMMASSASATGDGSQSQSVSVGTVVGGVLGGVVFGILVSILVTLLIIRQRKAEQNYAYDGDATSVSIPNYSTDAAADSSGMHEHSQSRLVNRPAKLSQQGWSNSVAVDRQSNTMSPVDSSMSGPSGLDDTLAHPPAYYAVSSRAHLQA